MRWLRRWLDRARAERLEFDSPEFQRALDVLLRDTPKGVRR